MKDLEGLQTQLQKALRECASLREENEQLKKLLARWGVCTDFTIISKWCRFTIMWISMSRPSCECIKNGSRGYEAIGYTVQRWNNDLSRQPEGYEYVPNEDLLDKFMLEEKQ